jgi:hypothetical protein
LIWSRFFQLYSRINISLQAFAASGKHFTKAKTLNT